MGVIYLAVGGAGFIISREYSFGSGARMGPGYFPTIVSFLLVALGIVAIARSFIVQGQRVRPFAWKPMILVIGSSVAFALLLNSAGLIVALTATVLISAAASERFHLEWRPMLGLVGLVAACSLVFVKGLGVPMPLIGTWLQPMLPAWLGG